MKSDYFSVSKKPIGGSNMFSKAFLDYQSRIPTAPPVAMDYAICHEAENAMNAILTFINNILDLK